MAVHTTLGNFMQIDKLCLAKYIPDLQSPLYFPK